MILISEYAFISLHEPTSRRTRDLNLGSLQPYSHIANAHCSPVEKPTELPRQAHLYDTPQTQLLPVKQNEFVTASSLTACHSNISQDYSSPVLVSPVEVSQAYSSPVLVSPTQVSQAYSSPLLVSPTEVSRAYSSPVLVSPDLQQSSTGQSNTGQPGLQKSTTGQSNTGQPGLQQSSTGQSN